MRIFLAIVLVTLSIGAAGELLENRVTCEVPDSWSSMGGEELDKMATVGFLVRSHDSEKQFGAFVVTAWTTGPEPCGPTTEPWHGETDPIETIATGGAPATGRYIVFEQGAQGGARAKIAVDSTCVDVLARYSLSADQAERAAIHAAVEGAIRSLTLDARPLFRDPVRGSLQQPNISSDAGLRPGDR